MIFRPVPFSRPPFAWPAGRIAIDAHWPLTGPDPALPYALPGFVDAHVHVESSLLVPSEFARLAVTHGTVATVSDPHEIGNVLGVAGVEYMLENASPFALQILLRCAQLRAGHALRNGRGRASRPPTSLARSLKTPKSATWPR